MAKLKGTKRQTMIYKTLHSKQKIEQYEPHENWGRGWTQVVRDGKQHLLH